MRAYKFDKTICKVGIRSLTLTELLGIVFHKLSQIKNIKMTTTWSNCFPTVTFQWHIRTEITMWAQTDTTHTTPKFINMSVEFF